MIVKLVAVLYNRFKNLKRPPPADCQPVWDHLLILLKLSLWCDVEDETGNMEKATY